MNLIVFLIYFFGILEQSDEETLVVVGGGAAGMYGAIRAKTIAPYLNVVVIEKGSPLSKVCMLHGLFTKFVSRLQSF